jgi:2-dehydro-3-deoxyphosphogluconate aldolase/(4S)-4-hydroxy-2-oxoglutarate aldolase
MIGSVTPQNASNYILDSLKVAKIIPIVTIRRVTDAVPIVESLLEGGLTMVELTLRTRDALEVIEVVTSRNDIAVAAGTLIYPEDVTKCLNAGVKFGVCPGTTDELIETCENKGLPILGGVSSVSEIMRLMNRGYKVMKFFPAEALGGVKTLKAIGGPLPQISFCPTGGISYFTAQEYLELPNVIAIGGSWIATEKLIDEGNWKEIRRLAREAATLGDTI